MNKMKNINFIITEDTAKDICKHFNKNYKELEDYEICELLDELIDIALYTK